LRLCPVIIEGLVFFVPPRVGLAKFMDASMLSKTFPTRSMGIGAIGWPPAASVSNGL